MSQQNDVEPAARPHTAQYVPAATRAPQELLDSRMVASLRPIAILLYQVIDACVASRFQAANGPIDDEFDDEAQPEDDVARGTGALVAELLASKKADGLSKRYIETLRSHLVRFAAVFHKPIGLVTTAEIEQWLRDQNLGGRARNNVRGSIVTLFHFARKQGHLPKGSPTEADDLAKAKDRGGDIGILAPIDLAQVMSRAPERVRLFLAIGAFTGMRSSEILRLDWRDVNFERSFITVAAEKAKTATRRLVPIQPNLMQWLAPYRERQGSIFKTPRDASRAISFAKTCGIAWPNNALRHSYATYRLAVTADAARVALEMGNSPQKLMTNYRELADEKEANGWFAILPKNPGNVIFVRPK